MKNIIAKLNANRDKLRLVSIGFVITFLAVGLVLLFAVNKKQASADEMVLMPSPETTQSGFEFIAENQAAENDEADEPEAEVTADPTAEAVEMPADEPEETPVEEPEYEPVEEPADDPAQTVVGGMDEAPEDEELKNGIVTITVAGDCTLGGDYNTNAHERFDKCYDKNGASYFLSNVKKLFEEDDVTIVNLEGPLTTSTDKRHGRIFNFKGRAEYAKILSSSSVEAAGLANNHALDFGKQGLKDTAAALEAEGVGVCGYDTVWYTEADEFTLAFISVTAWDYTSEEICAIVKTAKENSDLTVVLIHWGEELVYKTTNVQRSLAHDMIDAGADLIVGSHSHVVGGLESYNGRYILYSTGNFCFGGSSSPTDYDCVVFRQSFRITDFGIADNGIALIPCRVSSTKGTNDYRPRTVDGDDAKRILKKIWKYSDIDGESIVWDPYMDKFLNEN